MVVDKRLIEFIVEARKRGFSDAEIKAPLFGKGWQGKDIDKAFMQLKDKQEKKIRIEISLPESVVKIVGKRARKNMLSLEEQVEDIIRRSAVTGKIRRFMGAENIDDLLVSIFSRRRHKKKL